MLSRHSWPSSRSSSGGNAREETRETFSVFFRNRRRTVHNGSPRFSSVRSCKTTPKRPIKHTYHMLLSGHILFYYARPFSALRKDLALQLFYSFRHRHCVVLIRLIILRTPPPHPVRTAATSRIIKYHGLYTCILQNIYIFYVRLLRQFIPFLSALRSSSRFFFFRLFVPPSPVYNYRSAISYYCTGLCALEPIELAAAMT